MKKVFSVLVEFIFGLAYFSTIILAILDIIGIANFIQLEQWTKILVMLFGTVGIAVLWDKHKLEANIDPKIELIKTNQEESIDCEKKIYEVVPNLKKFLNSKDEIYYFQNKTQFYLNLTEVLLKLPSGAEVDVTNFEKNYNIPYDVGENVHIKAFMKTWTDSVKSNKISVRQLVHITSTQDYFELVHRTEQYQDNHNFVISAIVGLPIAPYQDIMILNQEYIFIGLSNDITSPNNLSFGYAIRSTTLASSIRNYFNIYWSSQFSTIIKDKDEIKERNLNKIKTLTYDIDHNIDIQKYNQLMLCVYYVNDRNNKIISIIENLNILYRNVCCNVIQKDIDKKLTEYYGFINNKMNGFFEFDKKRATELISKMIYNARTKISAVSLDIDSENFWMAEEGEKVFYANLDVMSKKSVEIERIFVSSSDKKSNLDKIISEQIRSGIEVYFTEYKEGMGETFEDFLIIDNEALLVLNAKIKVSLDRKEIEKYWTKFRQIKNMGSKFTINI